MKVLFLKLKCSCDARGKASIPGEICTSDGTGYMRNGYRNRGNPIFVFNEALSFFPLLPDAILYIGR